MEFLRLLSETFRKFHAMFLRNIQTCFCGYRNLFFISLIAIMTKKVDDKFDTLSSTVAFESFENAAICLALCQSIECVVLLHFRISVTNS